MNTRSINRDEQTIEVKQETVKVGKKDIPRAEFDELRSKGRIVFHLKEEKDGLLRSASGRLYRRDEKGCLRRVCGGQKMSKKQRRKMRREAFAAEGEVV